MKFIGFVLGVLHGIHSGNGRLLWTLPVAVNQLAGPVQAALMPWQISHSFGKAPSVAVVVSNQGSPERASSRVLVINAHTGRLLETHHLPFSPEQVNFPHKAPSSSIILPENNAYYGPACFLETHLAKLPW